MKINPNEIREYKCPRCRKILTKHIQGGEIFYICDKHGIGRREIYELNVYPQPKSIFKDANAPTVVTTIENGVPVDEITQELNIVETQPDEAVGI